MGTTASGKVRKVGGKEIISVTVEVIPGGGFSAVCDFSAPADVRGVEGEPFDASGIAIMCMSGARFARHFFSPWDARVVIRAARGVVSAKDVGEGLGIAMVLAIGRALGREDSIPATAFQGTFGSWEASCDD